FVNCSCLNCFHIPCVPHCSFADTFDAESRKSESSESPVAAKKRRRLMQESADYFERKTKTSHIGLIRMRRTFIIVGPTATGTSEIAADVAREVGAEIVSADALQLYRELDLLSAKPDPSTLATAPH